MFNIDVVPNPDQLFDPHAVIPCTTCGLTVQISFFNKHVKKLHERNVLRYFCCEADCRRKKSSDFDGFNSLASVKQHYKLVHGKDKFLCPKCSRKFKTKHSMQQHYRECGVKYLCSCDVLYSTKRGLQLHIKNSKHIIPENLKHLFQQNIIKHKPKKEILFETSNKIQKYRSILPKGNGKMTTMSNSKHLFVPITSTAKSSIFFPNLKTIKIKGFQNRKINSQNYKSSHDSALQFSNVVNRSTVDGSCQTALNHNVHQSISTTTNDCYSDMNNQLSAKDISSQTDLNFWLNNEAIDKILCENNATQTNETETTMCQTDWNFEDLIEDENEKWQCTSTNSICDAQNQTSSLGYFDSNQQGLYFNKELSDVITTTAETQTLTEETFSEEQIDNLDILLNNIETQTDFPSFSFDDSYNNLINTSTQTSFANAVDLDFPLSTSETPFSNLF